jgi:hypothetical protein
MRFSATGERELVFVRWCLAGKDDTVPTRLKHMHAHMVSAAGGVAPMMRIVGCFV